MAGFFQSCCCGGCKFIQANAWKMHGGFPGNEAPWIGSFASAGTTNVGVVAAIEADVLQVTNRNGWPQFRTKWQCGENRFLKADFSGTSTYVDATPTRINVTWRGSIEIDRDSGWLKEASFYCDDGLGGGEVLTWSASLNLSTGVYTVVDNITTAGLEPGNPYWRTVGDTAFAGSGATIQLNPNGASFAYYFVDSGHGLGTDFQTLTVILSEPYAISECEASAQELLDMIDFENMSTGGLSGAALAWNTEINVGFTGWPPTPDAVVVDVCPSIPTPANFDPYISRLYGTEASVDNAVNPLGRVFDMPTIPTPSNVADIAAFETFWIDPMGSSVGPRSGFYLSKLKAETDGEASALYSAEYQLCSCPPAATGMAFDCDPANFSLTGITDCDTAFLDGTEPSVSLSPGDLFFEFGVSALFSKCRTGDCLPSMGCEAP